MDLDITELLIAWNQGDKDALEKLMPVVYGELHRIAKRSMYREQAGHTLQPTALVNEVYMKLINQRRANWQNRAHFFAIAAQMMRRILVDHVRGQMREKRISRNQTISLDIVSELPVDQPEVDVVALDTALDKLEALAPRQCRIVELRFFSGLNVDETAEALNISAATVKREWAVAKTFLFRELKHSEE